jgi:cyclic pyranopterin phosphate synthase
MGGEPTLYTDLPQVINFIKGKNRDIDVSLVTNGIVNNDLLMKYIESGVDRINVSLHGLRAEEFCKVTKGEIWQLEKTLGTIDFLLEHKMLGKINYVLLKGENEEEFYDVLSYVNEKNIVVDVLNYLGENENDIERYYYSFEEIIKMINKKYSVVSSEKYANLHSIESLRLFLSEGGIVNLKINPLNEQSFLKSCEKCKKIKYCKEGISAIRLTTAGIIKPCLFREDLLFDMKVTDSCTSIADKVTMVSDYLEGL